LLGVARVATFALVDTAQVKTCLYKWANVPEAALAGCKETAGWGLSCVLEKRNNNIISESVVKIFSAVHNWYRVCNERKN